MPTKPLSKQEAISRLLAMQRHGWPGASITDVCARMGVNRANFYNFVNHAVPALGMDARDPATWKAPEAPVPFTPAPIAASDPALPDRVVALLRKQPRTLQALASELSVSLGQALDACHALKSAGKNIEQQGESWVIHDMPSPAFIGGNQRILLSDENHVFRFGAVADSHLGSKYERLDALNDIYDRFAAEGITHVMHCGNWIEGEARFNRADVAIHGMDAQLKYLADNYPKRPGIQTWAVTGDDHEGWYGQRELTDIGKLAQNAMQEAGRTDWVNLGFMEAHVLLRNRESGKDAVLAVVHPGGGSSYAESYVVQKIIESLDGGEKPSIALYGHYHKALAGEYRNVFWMLVPSTKDQDVFMRKKRLRSVVGGAIIEVSQYPHDGALHSFKPWIWRYFNKGYYENDRWSHAGAPVMPERAAR